MAALKAVKLFLRDRNDKRQPRIAISQPFDNRAVGAGACNHNLNGRTQRKLALSHFKSASARR